MDVAKQKTKTRNSGFELLRIIAMLMIIAHHLALYGTSEGLTGFNSVFYTMLALGGKLGVNLYVLISGYFLSTKKYNLKRFINIIIQTTFYTILCFSTYCIATNSFDITNFFHAVLPVIFYEYWFVTIYFILLLIFPLLNIIIKNISKRTHLLIIGIGLILTAFLPLVLNLHYFDSHILWFIELYFIAAYIRIYDVKIKTWILCITLIIFCALQVTLTQLVYNSNIYSANTALNLLIAINIFLLFKKLTFENKFINLISSATFGVYLIHENVYIRPRLWGIFKNLNVQASPIFFIYAIIAILTVFVGATLIELFRIYALHKPLEKFIMKKQKDKQKIKDETS